MTCIGEIERRLVKSKKVNSPLYGAIAQLGERIVRNDEVVGSIPTSSTNFNDSRRVFDDAVAPYSASVCTDPLRCLPDWEVETPKLFLGTEIPCTTLIG